MKPNLATLALAAALAVIAVPVSARDAVSQASPELIKLKDGSTLYVFKDGKMAKEDKFGRAVNLKKGDVLEAADGRKLPISSNESGRLELLLNDGHRN